MKKKKLSFEGTLKNFPNKNIYLNINHLDKGSYVLKTMHKNKLVKKITFKK